MNKPKKLRSLDELTSFLSGCQNLVVTTGAFDVPHIGHIRYLRKTRSYGDTLVLILHSDELISSRKGPGRPICKESARVARLTRGNTYECVDYIYVAKTQADVYEAISTLRPRTLVTSKTTEDVENCPDTMLVLFSDMMEVVVLEAQAKVHSTDIIKKRGLVKTT